MRSRCWFFARALLLVSALCIQGTAHAGPVGFGISHDGGASFELTTTPPFFVANPTGPDERRGAVEFDLRDAIATGERIFDGFQLVVRGVIEVDKDLTIYAYTGDGDVTAGDFNLGLPIATKPLTAAPGVVSRIEFDLEDSLIDQFGTDYPEFLGFNLRESISDGAVVTIEYLVLGTFLALSLVVNQAAVPVPATLLLMGIALAGLGFTRRKRS